MTFQKRIVSSLICTNLLLALPASAQFDEMPPLPPPPPPPIEDFNSMNGGQAGRGSTPRFNGNGLAAPQGSSSGGFPAAGGLPGGASSFNNSANGSGSGNGFGKNAAPEKKGVLEKNQKNKFAKANPEDITGENFPETIESFDFPNVEITDVIKAISELTGKNFIIDSTVRGKITIVAPSKITVAEAYKAFLSALAINGFTVVPSGAFLKIKNARQAQKDNIDTYSGSYYPNSDQMITKIIHLKHIQGENVTQQLRGLTSNYGDIASFTQTNSLIISDFGSNIDRIMKIINQLDVPGFEEQLEVIGIKYTKAKDLADLIDKVVNKGDKKSSSGGGFSAGVPRFAPGGATGAAAGSKQGTTYFTVFPDERTNSLIIVGNKAGINRVKKLIAQLDYKVNAESQGGVFVYNVKHGEAEKIAQTLQDVAKDGSPKPASSGNAGFGFGAIQGQAAIREGLFGGDVSIKADKSTNSLVISASKTDYEKVLNLLSKLDIPRDQVYVEGIIMEMALNDGFDQSAGLIKFNEGGGKAGFSSNSTDIQNFLNPLAGGSAILGFSQGTVKIPNILDTTKPDISVPSLVGYINFLKSISKTNILSTPQILAMDNQEAEIEVGDSVIVGATVTAGQNGSPPQTSPTMGEAKIALKIKPFISPKSDKIRMEIAQSVSQLSTISVPKNFEGLAQPLSNRKVKTTIIVNNNDTAVIGGLIKDEEYETVKKVPLLGDLPLLGWLFKGKKSDKKKVNMLVFLTPRIIRNTADQKNLVDLKIQERLKFVKQQGGKDSFGGTIDKILKRETKANTPNTEAIQK